MNMFALVNSIGRRHRLPHRSASLFQFARAVVIIIVGQLPILQTVWCNVVLLSLLFSQCQKTWLPFPLCQFAFYSSTSTTSSSSSSSSSSSFSFIVVVLILHRLLLLLPTIIIIIIVYSQFSQFENHKTLFSPPTVLRFRVLFKNEIACYLHFVVHFSYYPIRRKISLGCARALCADQIEWTTRRYFRRFVSFTFFSQCICDHPSDFVYCRWASSQYLPVTMGPFVCLYVCVSAVLCLCVCLHCAYLRLFTILPFFPFHRLFSKQFISVTHIPIIFLWDIRDFYSIVFFFLNVRSVVVLWSCGRRHHRRHHRRLHLWPICCLVDVSNGCCCWSIVANARDNAAMAQCICLTI